MEGDFAWGQWIHNTIYRWYAMELYPWNLYNLLTKVTPISPIFKKGDDIWGIETICPKKN